MPSRPIHLAIADDHALYRKTLKFYLSEQQGITVVIQASDVSHLLNMLKAASIDVLILDLFMPGLHGVDAVRMIREEYPDLKILVVSMSQDMDLISDLLETGIHGYVSKADEPDELVKAVRTISEHRLYHNRIFTDALYWNRQSNIRAHMARAHAPLNEREKKILQLIWEEKSNKEIGDELFLGVRSVEKIRQDIKEKLGIKSTVGLLKYAIDKRIIGVSSKASDFIIQNRMNE